MGQERELKMNEAQQQKEKEKLEYLSHIIATIAPDPVKSKHCTRCNGKGFQIIDVAVHQGEIHYHIIPCCGLVGTSPYAKLAERIALTNKFISEEYAWQVEQFADIKKYQFWRSICSFFKGKSK
jgi:hypothetical protein